MTYRRKMRSRLWENRKAMTYRRKMKSRSWENREDHDLQEENEIQVMGKQERL